MLDIDEATKEEFVEKIDEVLDSLEGIKDLLFTEPDVRSLLHDGGPDMPYALRNLLPDLEGAQGGWLMAEGESFLETMRTFRDLITGDLDQGEDEEEGEDEG